jgi:putative MATE family efflux protein
MNRTLQKKTLTSGKPATVLFRFALPLILGNLFQQFYLLVDSIVVGKFIGEKALAAVGASYAITNVFIAIAIGASIGSSIVIAQYFGSGQLKKTRSAITTALVIITVLGIFLGGLGFASSRILLEKLKTPVSVLTDANNYLSIYFSGLAFLFLYNGSSSVFTALGDSNTPLKLLIGSSLLNISLDILFVTKFHRGVRSVAYATLIAQCCASCIALYILHKRLHSNSTADTAVSSEFFNSHICRNMLKISIPSILQQSIVNIGMLLVQSVVNGFGADMLAGYSIGMRYESLCIVPMVGIGNAVSTFTAQNIGAKDLQRVRKGYHASFWLIGSFAITICLLFQFFDNWFISFFLDASPSHATITVARSYTRFQSFFYVLIGLKMSTDGLLRGAGDMLVFTCANLLNLTIRVAAANIFAPIIGIQAVWMAVPLGWSINFIVSFSYYRTGKWKRIPLISKQ